MAKEITKVRGTIDKLETEIALETAIIQKISRWLTLANFKKIDTPILEKVDLFIDSIGSETDVVSKELFFAQGKNPSDEKICLRPEFTAGIFRAFLENQTKLVTPWKVFSVGPCFRYERPQKGRLRQFDQISLEIIDAKAQLFDADILILLDRIFFHEFQLTNYILKINYIGSITERTFFKEALLVFLETEQTKLCADCQKRRFTNPLRCLDCKNVICSELLKQAPKITDFLDNATQEAFTQIQHNLNNNSVNFTIDPLLVRGLDYYQGLVFEFVSGDLGAQSTFCGGGRYELAQRLGNDKAIPCVGAGIGLTRLCMLVDKKPQNPKTPKPHCTAPIRY